MTSELRLVLGDRCLIRACCRTCRFAGTQTSYIEPGSPWQNPWVESYGSRMRDEILAIEQFDSLLEAQGLVADWRDEYNTHRPHTQRSACHPNRVPPTLADRTPNTLTPPGPTTGVLSRCRTPKLHLSTRRFSS